ncbi:MAG: hypothetical protein ACLUKL_10345 [Parasutterella excrementihominis]|uniref:hypothetical protein n=1 Tax=Parasutterella excrementihominis TaxID=487175 RepID=UPI00399153DF
MSKVFLCGDPHGEFDHIRRHRPMAPGCGSILGDLTPSHSLDEIFKGLKEPRFTGFRVITTLTQTLFMTVFGGLLSLNIISTAEFRTFAALKWPV